MGYVRNHWRGNQSLAWSFWINLVLIRGLVIYAGQFTHPPSTEKTFVALLATVTYFLLLDGLLLVWQIRGVIKSGDHYVSGYGSPILATASHFGIAFALLFTGISIHSGWQSLYAEDRSDSANYRHWSHSLLGDYVLTLADGGRLIHLEGDLRIGVTDQLTMLLDENPLVRGIVLASNGGRVSEGRGLARLFRDRVLETRVYDECKSACTTAFIGGQRRILGPDGKLGFHQFSLDGVYNNPYIDPKSEQQVDLDFYAQQGVSPSFLEEVFKASHREMWFPTPARLLASGVIHEILPVSSGTAGLNGATTE